MLLHAGAIASFVIPSFDADRSDASLKPLAVALLPGQAAEMAPARPEAIEAPAAAKPVPTLRQAPPQPAVNANATEPAAASDNGPIAATSVPGIAVAAAAGRQRTGASIPANYAAGNKKPDYPLLARRLEEQGTVVLRVLVREDGTAGEVVVRQSSGHELLDQSARAAVEKWRFQPASVNNVAVAEWYQVAIPFTLYN